MATAYKMVKEGEKDVYTDNPKSWMDKGYTKASSKKYERTPSEKRRDPQWSGHSTTKPRVVQKTDEGAAKKGRRYHLGMQNV